MGAEGVVEEFNKRSSIEMAKPPVFNGEASRVGDFIMAYRLYLRMRIRRVTVDEQIQWILLFVQERSADMWKENVLKNLKLREVEFRLAEEFLLELKKEFEGGDKELVKIKELRRIEQRERTMEKFV